MELNVIEIFENFIVQQFKPITYAKIAFHARQVCTAKCIFGNGKLGAAYFLALKEASLILVDGCDNSCIDQTMVIDSIVSKIKGVKEEHVVKLRRSGPFYQGEMVIEVPSDMTMADVQKLKDKISDAIKEKIPTMDRLTITAVPYQEGKAISRSDP